MKADPARALAEAVALFNAGRVAEALQHCERALGAAPQDAGLQQLQATLLLVQGDAAAALAAIAPVLARHPTHAPARRVATRATLRRGAELIAQGRPQDAVPLLTDLSAREPDLAEAWHELGRALQASRRPAEAQAAGLRATALAPELAPAWFALALACEDMHRPAEAAAALRRALALDASQVEAWLNLGLLEQQLGRLDAALDCHARAWHLRPALLGRIAMALCSQRCGAVWLDADGLEQELRRRASA